MVWVAFLRGLVYMGFPQVSYISSKHKLILFLLKRQCPQVELRQTHYKKKKRKKKRENHFMLLALTKYCAYISIMLAWGGAKPFTLSWVIFMSHSGLQRDRLWKLYRYREPHYLPVRSKRNVIPCVDLPDYTFNH